MDVPVTTQLPQPITAQYLCQQPIRVQNRETAPAPTDNYQTEFKLLEENINHFLCIHNSDSDIQHNITTSSTFWNNSSISFSNINHIESKILFNQPLNSWLVIFQACNWTKRNIAWFSFISPYHFVLNCSVQYAWSSMDNPVFEAYLFIINSWLLWPYSILRCDGISRFCSVSQLVGWLVGHTF